MKKLLILIVLIFTTSIFAQAEFEKIAITENVQDLTADKVNVQSTNGVLNWQFISDFQNNKPYFSTGLLKNGLLTINADNTKFDLSAGIGVYSDFSDPENVTSKVFNFPAFSAVSSPYLATSNITYVAVNYNGGSPTIVMQASPFSNIQIRGLVVVGAVIHSNFTTINTINNISSPSNDVGNSVADLFNFLGARNQDGNVYSANGANLQLNKSAGTILKYGANFHVDSKNPHNVSLPEQLSLTFRYRLRGGFEGTDRINIDTDNYDLNNVLTTVPPAKPYQIQTIFIPQTGFTRIQYGQDTYNTLADAVAAINTRKFVTETNLATQFVKVAYLVVKKGATSLNVAADADIRQATQFDGTASGGVALTYQSIIDALGYVPANDVDVVKLTGDQSIAGIKEFENIKIKDNPVASSPNRITQVMGVSDSWSIYGDATIPDQGKMIFELGDNGTSIAGNGQAFEFKYNNLNNGTSKTPLTIDYDEITAITAVKANSFIKSGGLSSQALLANGSVLTNPISGTSTTGYVSFWNSGTTQTGESSLFWDSVNKRLGIGNSNPSSVTQSVIPYNRLDATARVIDRKTSNDADFRAGMQTSITGGASAGVRKTTLQTGAETVATGAFTNSGEMLLINPNGGFVGINNPSPTTALGVGGTVTASPATVDTELATWGQAKAVASSGAYTPTLTNGPNVTGVTNVSTMYTKIGKTVSLSFAAEVTTTAANTFSRFKISVPFTAQSATSYVVLANASNTSSLTASLAYNIGASLNDVSIAFTHPVDTTVIINGYITYQTP